VFQFLLEGCILFLVVYKALIHPKIKIKIEYSIRKCFKLFVVTDFVSKQKGEVASVLERENNVLLY
jgi:hypothetical protein